MAEANRVHFSGTVHPPPHPNSYKGVYMNVSDMDKAEKRVKSVTVMSEHEGKEIGKITRAKMSSDDGCLWVKGYVRSDLPEGAKTIEKMRSGKQCGLSLGLKHFVDPTTYHVEDKEITEVSIVSVPNLPGSYIKYIDPPPSEDTSSGQADVQIASPWYFGNVKSPVYNSNNKDISTEQQPPPPRPSSSPSPMATQAVQQAPQGTPTQPAPQPDLKGLSPQSDAQGVFAPEVIKAFQQSLFERELEHKKQMEALAAEKVRLSEEAKKYAEDAKKWAMYEEMEAKKMLEDIMSKKDGLRDWLTSALKAEGWTDEQIRNHDVIRTIEDAGKEGGPGLQTAHHLMEVMTAASAYTNKRATDVEKKISEEAEKKAAELSSKLATEEKLRKDMEDRLKKYERQSLSHTLFPPTAAAAPVAQPSPHAHETTTTTTTTTTQQQTYRVPRPSTVVSGDFQGDGSRVTANLRPPRVSHYLSLEQQESSKRKDYPVDYDILREIKRRATEKPTLDLWYGSELKKDRKSIPLPSNVSRMEDKPGYVVLPDFASMYPAH